MLNDWQDRPEQPYRKGLFGSREYLIGAASMLLMLAIVAGVAACMLR